MPRRLIVEADGGSRGNPGPAAYGALVRDAATGEVLVEVAESIGTASNNVAEYRGLVAGLSAARELDPTASVEARMDSKLVVEQMSGRWQIKHPSMRPLALQARAILPPDQVTYTWVPRERNREADRLANEALDDAREGRVWSPRPAGGTPRVPAVAARVDEAEVEPVPRNKLVGWAPDLGPPTTLLLLRHGETAHTAQKRFSGAGGDDPELSELGAWQAARAAQALTSADIGTGTRTGTGPSTRKGVGPGSRTGTGQDIGVDAVVSSPLRRTLQTAEIVARRLGLRVRAEDGFRECSFGAWDGCTFAEIQERWPTELAAWLGSTGIAPPGGESFDAVAARVRLARDKILARHPGQVVLVVTHVTPIKTLVRLALGAPADAIYRMELQPASMTEIQEYADGNASLRRFNDTGHLHRMNGESTAIPIPEQGARGR